jgi:ribA/ribD-fused uncharacterized protein
MIKEFRGENWFLSNFFITPVTFRGIVYPSSENAYMSAKSDDPQWKAYCANPNITPADAKENAKYIRLVNDWHILKFIVMEECLRSKFENPTLREKLLATGTQNIQEGNWWGDRIWGVDLKENPNIGENHLGRLLMKIRDELKAKP